MKARTIAGSLLLAFAAVSTAAFIVRQVRPSPADDGGLSLSRFAVTYLHGDKRCEACLSMGAMTEEAVRSGFSAELRQGLLEHRTVNYEAPGRERYGRDFNVVAPTVLLTEQGGGKVLRWKTLDRIWDLNGDKAAFQDFIRQETSAFLKGEGRAPADTVPVGWFLAAAAALGLGLLTAVSPCPLAANVAAISFLGRRVGRPAHVLFSGLLYSAGRVAAYIALGVILVGGLLSLPGLAAFLGRYVNGLLGPVLVAAGVFLLGLIEAGWSVGVPAEKLQARAEKGGLLISFVLGAVFALAFCPVSAAIFFGGLVPLSIKTRSWLLLPSVYGLATGLPVVAFAVLIAAASRKVGALYDRIGQVEKWMRRIAGVLFVAVGVYYSLIYVFRLIS